jgi:mono/diheme cytochrome c family protein
VFRQVPAFLVALAAFGLASCGSGRYSSSGFRLPADGDAARGKIAFQAFGCHTCHLVPGSDLPRPTVEPPVPVALGGMVSQPIADGYLVTSIINPSYQLAHYPVAQITTGGQSRMPHYADRMTVRQLTDIVEYLQAQYTIRPAPRSFPTN